MEIYSHSKHKVLITHFAGNSKRINRKYLDEFKEITFTMPDNINIVSIITKNILEDSPLNYQLNKNNISYLNPLKDKDVVWKFCDKVKYILEALNEADKEYTLILDGNDTAIVNDLNNIVDVFNTYNKDIIFNATRFRYPKVDLDNVKDRDKYGIYCWLNSGCCFGKIDKVKEFYNYIYSLILQDKTPVDCDQYYTRKAFNDFQDTVFFDYDCRIFQMFYLNFLIIDDNVFKFTNYRL
jgi:hypothetical protein